MSNKILITSLGVLAMALFALNLQKNSIENFAGNLPNFTYKVDRVAQQGDGFYTIPGNYQSSLSPRFSNVDYGANIRYNMPSIRNLGSPDTPLTFGNMVQDCSKVVEGYCGSCNGKNIDMVENYCRSCGAGCSVRQVRPSSSEMPLAGFSQGDHGKEMNSLEYTEAVDMLPVNDMTMMSADGQHEQVITYDRFMYANQRSRLYGLGDPIRGDLAIIPCKNEWFRPSVHPHIDLRDGAMAVMGGIDNGTNKQTLELQTAATGGLQQYGSGINYAVDKSMFASAAGGDLQVVSFP